MVYLPRVAFKCDGSTTNISTTTKNSLTNAIVINHEIIGNLASSLILISPCLYVNDPSIYGVCLMFVEL